MIMGYSAMSQKMVASSISCVENITTLELFNAVYEDLYATQINESVKPVDQIVPPNEWDAATYLHAKFEGSIYCGNADFGVDNTTNILVKRRKKGSFEWFTLFDIPANNVDDYVFTVIDPYSPVGDLEYAAVPIINGVESSYNIAEINYDFNGLLLIEKDKTVWAITDIVLSEDKNSSIGICNTLVGRYPYVFHNSENDYYTGSVSATFIDFSNCRMPDTRRIHEHYEDVMAFLSNKKPKILKYCDGRIRLISVTTLPNNTADEHFDVHTISFSYTEIGSTLSNKDMNKYSFLDVGEQWWSS